MKNNSGKAFIIIPLVVVIAILISYFLGWSIAARLNPEKTVHSLDELVKKVNEQLDLGAESGSFYVSGVTTDEINNINDYLCSTNGVVEQYSILEKSYGGMKVLFTYDISDNYYVIRKYKYGEGIPSDRPEAHKLYEKVVEIMDSIIEPSMTDYEKELAIHDYLVINCEYGYTDYSKEFAYRAYGALVQNKAVCNGYAEAMALLLSCADVENFIMTGEAGGELHAWNAVCLDGEWYQVDATWNDPIPDMGPYASHTYFNVSDDIMDDTHIWEADRYEACDGQKYNYFQYNGYMGNKQELKAIVQLVASKNITGLVEAVVYDYYEGYDLNFVFDTPGINSFQTSVIEYGNEHVLIMYLNKTQ